MEERNIHVGTTDKSHSVIIFLLASIKSYYDPRWVFSGFPRIVYKSTGEVSLFGLIGCTNTTNY